MKEMTKKTAVVAMAGIMAAGMLTGCGEKKLDGSKTVATVDGTEIPLGVVNLSVRDGQMQTEAMYRSYMGGSDFSIWDTEAEEGKTYGEQLVEQALEDVELMYIMKEKAADYDVELTDDDEKAIEEAAASFMEANSDEAIADLAVTEDQVKTFLELETYKQRIHDPIIADVDKDVSDEEAQQSSFSYVSISTADLSDDEIKQKKEDAQKIQDELTKDPVFKAVLEKSALASQPTVSRFFNRMDEDTLKQFQEISRILRKRLYSIQMPQAVILDLDSTLLAAYGKQEGRAFNFHYRSNGYHPLVCYDGITGDLIKIHLRDGAAYSCTGVTNFLQPILDEYLNDYPTIHLLLRGDSGFATPDLYKQCEENGTSYVIRLKENFIKESKSGFDFSAVSSHNRIVNANRVQVHALAYNIFNWFR